MQYTQIHLIGESIHYLKDGVTQTPISYESFVAWGDAKSFQLRRWADFGQMLRAHFLRLYLREAHQELVPFEFYDIYGNPCCEWVTPEEHARQTAEMGSYYAEEEQKRESAARHTEGYTANYYSSPSSF